MFEHKAAVVEQKHVETNIKKEGLVEAFNLFKELYVSELSLNVNVKGQDIVNLGEFARALAVLVSEHPDFFRHRNETEYNGYDAICAFVNSKTNHDSLVAAIHDLNLHKDESTFTYAVDGAEVTTSVAKALEKFLTMLYKNPPALLKPAEVKEEKPVNNMVILYRAFNGELTIGFPNTAARDQFKNTVRPAESKDAIPPQFRGGLQFANNPEGLTPAVYPENPRVVYCPSYQAAAGEFAVNLVTAAARKKLVELLGIRADGAAVKISDGLGGYQNKISYGNGLFTVYESIAGQTRRASQDSTLYFTASNPIFNVAGANLRINTATGEITAGETVVLADAPRVRRGRFAT